MIKKLSTFFSKEILKLFIFLSVSLFLFHPNAFAKENFSTDYNVTYKISENETTNVTLKIDLTNNTSQYYVSTYSVQTGFSGLSNISIKDSEGPIVYQISNNDKGSVLTFSFNKNVVGVNNIQSFTINFDTKEIASKFGSIWEVNIPGIANQSTFSTFNVSIVTPEGFGNPSIIKPNVRRVNFSERTLRFSKEDLGEGGIAISYGDYQIYNFDLKYNLYNKDVFPVTTELALPSNNNYQEVSIADITPNPLNVTVDTDGNWLAKYRMSGDEKITVKVSGKAKISYKPRQERLSDEQRKLFLKEDSYWETKNPQILKLAKELKTPKNIYDYVVANLNYDSDRVKETQVREGASGVLKNKKSAVCLEFTDLFIALARAAGIPARAVEGYANTTNTASRPLSLFKDVLHSWPQYYDTQQSRWIMVDPTWENTTGGIDYFNVFDFDHFAFVIKGFSSTYPIPAGGYKFPNKETQDVQVTIGRSYLSESSSLIATSEFKNNYLAGLPINGNILVTNSSGVLSAKQEVSVTSNSLFPNKMTFSVGEIPPYGYRLIPVNFKSKPILTNEEDTIRIVIDQNTIENQIVIIPFYKSVLFYYIFGGLIIGTILSVILISARRSRRLSIPK